MARNREEACRREVERRGFELVGVLHGDWSASSAYDAVLRSDELAGATAWVCANDQMAIGTMAALRDRGLDVPGSASVVGIDDIPEARYLRPALTTVHLEFEDQGRHSIERLVAMIEDREVPTEPEPSEPWRASSSRASLGERSRDRRNAPKQAPRSGAPGVK